MYGNTEYCMNFNSIDICRYLVDSVKTYCDVILLYNDDSQSRDYIKGKIIDGLTLDGDKENFTVSFYEHQTSIYIANEDSETPRDDRFNEEFMFINNHAKKNITSSYTFHNVVYEGALRNKTHKEILELINEFINILAGAKGIKVEETFVSQEGFQYPKNDYVIRIKNESGETKRIQKENILFIINE